MKNLPMHKQEGNQQAPDSPIPVQKRMNGLELHVRQRAMDQHRQPMIIVGDFLHVTRKVARSRVKLEGQNILQATLHTFDLRAVDRLSTHVHGDEQIGVGHDLGDTVKATDGLVRARKESGRLSIQVYRWIGWQVSWNEGAISCWLANIPAASLDCFPSMPCLLL